MKIESKNAKLRVITNNSITKEFVAKTRGTTYSDAYLFKGVEYTIASNNVGFTLNFYETGGDISKLLGALKAGINSTKIIPSNDILGLELNSYGENDDYVNYTITGNGFNVGVSKLLNVSIPTGGGKQKIDYDFKAGRLYVFKAPDRGNLLKWNFYKENSEESLVSKGSFNFNCFCFKPEADMSYIYINNYSTEAINRIEITEY